MLRRSQLRNGKTRVTFSLPADEPAGIVSVVGDFNDWCPGRHVLRRRSGARRSVAVDLAPGRHVFRYLATGGVWFDDPEADQITDAGSIAEV